MLSHAELLQAIPHALDTVTITGWGDPIRGKVRDTYVRDAQRLLITTDRVSAFDRVLGLIPYKGQVLNQLSLWWFEQTRALIRHHVIASPDPNVTIAHEAQALPVEVVVRGYITGVTSTSMWTLYAGGDRAPYGIPLPDGLRKNDPLPHPVITPTTKATGGAHDERLTREQILQERIIAPDLWEQIEDVAIRVFQQGQAIADRVGLILVDTKYEFGLIDGQLALIDEIHTPDSSRYWTKASYQPGGEEPENMDKEYLRKWFAAQGYRGDGIAPTMPAAFIAQVAARYIHTYELLTETPFQPADPPAATRIAQAIFDYNQR
ncbi:MAG: phosphoribosylaminoimidazolesuccinocarboxamide synthase [Anaerolineae bacterium]|jgi:phosphoribosylaminoimidazole-succinocarboxamide synthase|nr:phosphoribosylaminoimidazolesuccinocarboxamide synthase [Anaerolineae bacterium]